LRIHLVTVRRGTPRISAVLPVFRRAVEGSGGTGLSSRKWVWTDPPLAGKTTAAHAGLACPGLRGHSRDRPPPLAREGPARLSEPYRRFHAEAKLTSPVPAKKNP
jgi:hypothetical protein